jgi:acyl carrier protein
MNYTKIIKNLISEKAGADPEEIKRESYFEDDLNISELEVTELIAEIEEEFEIDLSETGDSVETVEDLINAVSEKLE